MPLPAVRTKADVGNAIRELHTGKTYARTKRKFGKKKADRQAVAISLSEWRKFQKRKR
jgi:hypothetical protein